MKKNIPILLIVSLLFTCLNLRAQGWERSYVDSVGHGMGRCAIQTMDGGFYFTSDPANIGMGQTAKLDSAGNIIWSTTIGGMSLAETSDSGCIVASTNYFNFIFRKLSSSGVLQWIKPYSFGGQHHMQYIDKVSDGNFITCGAADSNGIILKLDMNGDTLWSYKSSNPNWDIFEEVVETFDKGFVIVNRISPSNNTNVRIIKIDSIGNYKWAKTYTSMWSETICQTPDSGFVISAGLAGVSKLDKMGNLLWTKSVGTNIRLRSIKQTIDGGCIATGELSYSTSNDDIFLVKLNDSCNTQWSQTYYNGPSIDYAETVNVLTDGGYLVCGSSLGNTSVGIGEVSDDNKSLISISPNPFNLETVCHFDEVRDATLIIFDFQGEIIEQIDNINGSSILLNRKNLKSGMYFIRLIDKSKYIACKKMIITD